MYDSVFAGNSASQGAPQPASATDMAYGPAPGAGAGLASIFHPATGFGCAWWGGVAGLALLIIIRRSLPG